MKRFAALGLAFCLLAATPAFLLATESVGVTFGPAEPGGTLPVQSIQNGTPAALSGLAPGDLVLEVDGVSVQGKTPQQVLERIEEKVISGRSAVLIYRRGDWKTAALICPLRLSAGQEETLRFAGDFRTLHDEARKTWDELCGSFNRTMKGTTERELFLAKTNDWRKTLQKLGRDGANMTIPSGVRPEVRKDMADLALGLSKEQTLRIRTLALMEDYLAEPGDSRQPAVFSEMESPYEEMGDPQTLRERRWNRITETAQKARRAGLRLQVLFRKTLETSGLTDSGLVDPVL